MRVPPRRLAYLLFLAGAVLAVLATPACRRTPAPGTGANPPAGGAASSPAAAAGSSPADTAAGKLPKFQVDAVSTQEGNAVWYDVPAGSLAQRRAWSDEMTAASDKLATDTYVRVTRLENGKSVIVRITDHHIGEAGCIIDLDRTAAEALGMVKAGKTHVKVEVLALENADAIGPSPRVSPLKESGASEAEEKTAAQSKPGS